ncbi:MAG: hypothetical protein K2H38_10520, partial [Muribaculaceae bacterium]|nr:hypothetical protein [Muribaculaceae bacterium]
LPAQPAKKIDAIPINIAAQLVEKTDSAKVASTLEYYGYHPQGIEDGYQVMRTPIGNEIRFSFTYSESKYPTVIVKTTGTSKSIYDKLKELDFEKSGNGYEKMRNRYSQYKTHCSLGRHSTLIFRRSPNQK